jgi:hypothetical protein
MAIENCPIGKTYYSAGVGYTGFDLLKFADSLVSENVDKSVDLTLNGITIAYENVKSLVGNSFLVDISNAGDGGVFGFVPRGSILDYAGNCLFINPTFGYVRYNNVALGSFATIGGKTNFRYILTNMYTVTTFLEIYNNQTLIFSVTFDSSGDLTTFDDFASDHSLTLNAVEMVGLGLPNQCIGIVYKPKTTNATLSYNGVDYPIGIGYPIKTTLSLNMLRSTDAQNLVFWRDKGVAYDKINSDITIKIDNNNTEYVGSDNIKALQDILVGRIDTVANPVLATDSGVFPFTPMHDDVNLEIGILKSDYNRARDIKQRWNEYKLTISNIGTLLYAFNGSSCPTKAVWSLDGLGLPQPTIKEMLPLVFADRHLQQGIDVYKTPTIAKGEIVEIEVEVTNDIANTLLTKLSVNLRATQFVVTAINPLFIFGQQYTATQFNCILSDNKIECTVIDSDRCKVKFSIQNRGLV